MREEGGGKGTKASVNLLHISNVETLDHPVQSRSSYPSETRPMRGCTSARSAAEMWAITGAKLRRDSIPLAEAGVLRNGACRMVTT